MLIVCILFCAQKKKQKVEFWIKITTKLNFVDEVGKNETLWTKVKIWPNFTKVSYK